MLHDKRVAFCDKVKAATYRSRYNNVNCIVEAHNVVLERRSSSRDHALNAHVFAELFNNGRCL